MSRCTDAVREDVLSVGHCGAVSGLLSCSAYSDNNSSFIKDHNGKNKQSVILVCPLGPNDSVLVSVFVKLNVEV